MQSTFRNPHAWAGRSPARGWAARVVGHSLPRSADMAAALTLLRRLAGATLPCTLDRTIEVELVHAMGRSGWLRAWAQAPRYGGPGGPGRARRERVEVTEITPQGWAKLGPDGDAVGDGPR